LLSLQPWRPAIKNQDLKELIIALDVLFALIGLKHVKQAVDLLTTLGIQDGERAFLPTSTTSLLLSSFK